MLDDFSSEQGIAYKILVNSIVNNKCSHAYLINTNGYSKGFDLAVSFAKYILCPLNKTNNQNCVNCNQCHLIDENAFSDLKIISSDGLWIKKEQTDELQSAFSLKSINSGKLVYIINGVENLNVSASNSILKFLEEPSDGIVAILVTDNIYNVLNTIVSRCQVINLNNVGVKSDNMLVNIASNLFNDSGKIDEFVSDNDSMDKVSHVIDFIVYLDKNKLDTILYIDKLWNSFFVSKDDYYKAMRLPPDSVVTEPEKTVVTIKKTVKPVVPAKDSNISQTASRPIQKATLSAVYHNNYSLNDAIYEILCCLSNVSEKKFYGVSVLTDILKGSNSEKIKQNKLYEIPEYGALKNIPYADVRAMIEWMIEKHFILHCDFVRTHRAQSVELERKQVIMRVVIIVFPSSGIPYHEASPVGSAQQIARAIIHVVKGIRLSPKNLKVVSKGKFGDEEGVGALQIGLLVIGAARKAGLIEEPFFKRIVTGEISALQNRCGRLQSVVPVADNEMLSHVALQIGLEQYGRNVMEVGVGPPLVGGVGKQKRGVIHGQHRTQGRLGHRKHLDLIKIDGVVPKTSIAV